jgi:hypothetical protein
MSLDDLDRERSGRFVISVNDEPAELRSPTDMTWNQVAACINDLDAFRALSGMPGSSMPAREIARARWIAHFGLTPDDGTTRRLASIMDKYAPQLEADFPQHYPGIGPADLWRARKWRCLLNLIDHLPQNTHYHNSLMRDPEHAKRVAEYKIAHPDTETSKAPPWNIWSPQYEALQSIIDELRVLRATLVGVNGGKPGKPEFTPKPTSEIQKAVHREKWRAHDKLKAGFLPNGPQHST